MGDTLTRRIMDYLRAHDGDDCRPPPDQEAVRRAVSRGFHRYTSPEVYRVLEILEEMGHVRLIHNPLPTRSIRTVVRLAAGEKTTKN